MFEKKILVTGGGRGIGREITRLLVERGAKVIIAGRNQEHLNEAVAEHGSAVTAISADLADKNSLRELVDKVTGEHPDLAGIINNAGIQTQMNLVFGDTALWMNEAGREIAVNFEAPVSLCIGLMPVLRTQPKAAILNVSSGLALAPKQSSPVYCATKAGLSSFTRTLRYQCKDTAPQIEIIDGILTIVDTDMTKGYGKGKMSPFQAARSLVEGFESGSEEIWVGSARTLRAIYRLSPALAYRIMRNR